MERVFKVDQALAIMLENRKYSMLIIALDCHFGHIERFIRNLKSVNNLVEITLFTDNKDLSEDTKNCLSDVIYRESVTPTSRLGRLKAISKLLNKRCLYKQFKKISTDRRYDIVNIQFTQYYMAYILGPLSRMTDHIVLTPWGSDVLRVESRIKQLFLRRVYCHASLITTSHTSSLGSVILKRYSVAKERMKPLAWGSETIDYINENLDRVSTAKAKDILHLTDKYVITCGYNAFKEQRHERIIEAIDEVKDQLPPNLILVFPFTYGVKSQKQQYALKLKNKCQELGIPVLFFEEYLSVEETFLLRRASDMFIHVQTTDGGNSTIMEYLICGNKVIHGSWMHYNWLDCPPRFYFPVDVLEELPNVIVEAFRADTPRIPDEVVTRIKNRGWKQKMIAWNEAFISCIQEN